MEKRWCCWQRGLSCSRGESDHGEGREGHIYTKGRGEEKKKLKIETHKNSIATPQCYHLILDLGMAKYRVCLR
jgi:hypothetical protein